LSFLTHFLHSSSFMVVPRFGIVLGIMVIVHELGHFAVAKWCGVRVEAFAIGFGKRLFGVVHNGTDYCVNLVPLGGYVKMAGVGDEPISGSEQSQATLDPGELQNHPRWQRALIAVAGPIANFILAFVLLAAAYMFDNQVPAFFRQPAVANYVSPNSQMAKTGIQPGDKIVYFDNQENPSFGEILERAPANFNRQTPFGYEHDGQRVMTKLFVETKNPERPEDFDFQKLGMIPVAQTVPVQVDSLADNSSPAAKAGMQPGDKILSVDDQHPRSVDALLAYLQDQAGKPAQVTVDRKGEQVNLTVTPAQGETKLGKAWMLGIKTVPPPVTVEPMNFGKALKASYEDNVKNSQLIFDVLHRLFTRQVSVKSLSSPVGMSVQVNEAFEQQGWFPIVATMAMISLNLGIFNLLPIPILDGGMIVFLFIESLMRRDLNQQVKERVYQVAFVCLVLFAAVVIFNDITKLLPVHVKG
jgi:regulator of sigma E protease